MQNSPESALDATTDGFKRPAIRVANLHGSHIQHTTAADGCPTPTVLDGSLVEHLVQTIKNWCFVLWRMLAVPG